MDSAGPRGDHLHRWGAFPFEDGGDEMWQRNSLMKAACTLALLLATGASSLVADDRTSSAPEEARLTDLLALPDSRKFRSDSYIQAAHSLQALGKEKASALLLELAAKDVWPYSRTRSLCRMLFQAKPKSTFRRAAIGGCTFPGGTDYDDWPLEPIEIVDGVPFMVAGDCGLAGIPEPPKAYVRYCIEECDWSNIKFTPRSKDQKQKALEKLLSAPKLKGKLNKFEREAFEDQIK
jgi:hypothetical protein